MEFSQLTVSGVSFDAVPGLGDGVVHGFSTRLGGVSEGIFSSLNLGPNRGDDPARVRENFRRFCCAVGADPAAMVFAKQVHLDTVRPCTAADAGYGLDRNVDYEAAGLITDVPGLALVVFSADCLPILLHDPVRRVVAAVHAGWRGTALGIVERAVERMKEGYGCQASHIRCAIGPGISACCFETHADVPDAMTDALGQDALPYIQVMGEGKFKVDLKGINALRLRRAGVESEHIAISPDCTACRSDRYWSHRVTRGERGSQAALIALRP